MIVSCPSCRTRYRYPGRVRTNRLGRCGQCREEFPLVSDRPSYVVMPLRSAAVGIPGGLPIGVDDPQLLPRLQRAGVLADPAGVKDSELSTGERRARGVWRMLFELLCLSGLGLAGTLVGLEGPTRFPFALLGKADTIIWSVAGGCLGLAVGVLLIRWTAPKH